MRVWSTVLAFPALLIAVLCAGLAADESALAPSTQPQKTCPPCRQSLESYGKSVHVTHRGQRGVAASANPASVAPANERSTSLAGPEPGQKRQIAWAR